MRQGGGLVATLVIINSMISLGLSQAIDPLTLGNKTGCVQPVHQCCLVVAVLTFIFIITKL